MEPIDEPTPPVPPRDPEEWTDAQWLSWLTLTDDAAAPEVVVLLNVATSVPAALIKRSLAPVPSAAEP